MTELKLESANQIIQHRWTSDN